MPKTSYLTKKEKTNHHQYIHIFLFLSLNRFMIGQSH